MTDRPAPQSDPLRRIDAASRRRPAVDSQGRRTGPQTQFSYDHDGLLVAVTEQEDDE